MSDPLLQHIETQLAAHRPAGAWFRRWRARSAVALILSLRGGELHILMIKRAQREGDPWSGHMGFPGGRMDPGDAHGFAVATRETEEEIGLRLADHARCIGRLSEIRARHRRRSLGMVVTPFVFQLEREAHFTLNHEVDDVLWVPLSFLLDVSRRESMTWRHGRASLTLPCYFYRGCRIWGLSLMMLDELLDLVEGRNPARKRWRRG